MDKKFLIIDKFEAEALVHVLEREAFPYLQFYPKKAFIDVLDDLYYILDPKRYDELNQPCALGTCAAPEWSCYNCPFANRRPFPENMKMKAKAIYKREIQIDLYYRQFKGV